MNKNSTLLSNPLMLGIGGFVVGLLIGWLLLGWTLFPVQFTNAELYDLNPAAKGQWIVTVADAYGSNQDLNLARERLRGFSSDEISQNLKAAFTERNTKNDAEGAARIAGFAQQLGLNISSGGAPQPTKTPGGGGGGGLTDNLGQLLLLLAGVILLVAVVLGVYMFLRNRSAGAAGGGKAPATQATQGGTTSFARAEPVMTAPAQNVGLYEQPPSAPAMPVQTTTASRAPTSLAKSLGTFAATYKFGEDNYDTSFTLETARGEFLGETGMGSSETIGEGKPDKVTAFDVWLFDKTDVRTVTQILMSEAAYNDQATRQRLATKGELVLAEKGKHVKLETATLGVDAEIVDLVYASTPGLPPNSHFQKLIVEMVPAQK